MSMSMTIFIKGEHLPSRASVEEAIQTFGFDFKFLQKFSSFENLNSSDSINCVYKGQDTFVEIYLSSKNEMLEQSDIPEYLLFGYHKAITFTYGTNELHTNCVDLITLGLMHVTDTQVYHELSSRVSFDDLIEELINEDDSIIIDTSLYKGSDYNSDWTNDSVLESEYEFEIYYALYSSMYIGDTNDVEELKKKKNYVEIKTPSFYNNFKNYAEFYFQKIKLIGSSDSQNKEEELVYYYKSVMEIAGKYKKKPIDIQKHFLPSLWLGKGENTIPFPYNALDNMFRFFKQFDLNRRGLLFSNFDDNRSIEVYADNSYYYLLEKRGVVEEEIISNIKLEKDQLRKVNRELEIRVQLQKEIFVDALGFDLWSSPGNFKEELLQKTDPKLSLIWQRFLKINDWVMIALLIIPLLLNARGLIHWSVMLIALLLVIIHAQFKNKKK
jgi:hypothetical protein